MIVFNGIILNSVADVKIEDVYVSPISYEPQTRARAIAGGSEFVRNRAGTRTVSITFGLLNDNVVSRQAALMAISQWARTDQEYRLDLPGHPNRYLMCVCTSKPEPSLRQWWESKLRIVFTCYDNPYWNSIKEKSVACNTLFYVLGDAPPLMRIEQAFPSGASNQSYSIGGRTMTFDTIPSGYLVIDLNRQIAVVGGVSIMDHYNVNSRFPIPVCGGLTVTGTGTVFYRERWQ
jgi:phage-related protein